MNRYHRQIILKNFGEEAQKKLLNANVLVIGAGGLGCPALQYLAGAGTGNIGIADGDIVSLSNLHRQPLFATDDIGKNKALVAKEKLHRLNPEIQIESIAEKITVQNALPVIGKYDYVLDGTDNFPSRYLINDACVLLDKPLIYGAVSQYEGQVSVLNAGVGPKINYRDIFPQPPAEGEVLNCAEAGVLGVLPGMIGTMQAAEMIKLITGIGRPLINRLLTYNVLTHEAYTLDLIQNPVSQQFIPRDKVAFENSQYDVYCSAEKSYEIDRDEFEMLADKATIVDVREYGEMPVITSFRHLHIPLSVFESRVNEMNGDIIIFVCQSGIRSKKALDIFTSQHKGSSRLYSLKGGLRELEMINV